MGWFARRALGAWNVGHALNETFLRQIDRDLANLYAEVVWDVERFGAHAARFVGLARSSPLKVRSGG